MKTFFLLFLKFFHAVTCLNLKYLGCFIDKSNRDLPDYQQTEYLMTVDLCAKHCFDKNKTYMGVQYS